MPRTAHRRAGLLMFAAVQFVVLTGCAMAAYAGGTWFDATTTRYRLTENFLSDLGTTHSFSGQANYVSSALFLVALASIGAALVAFAWAWRGFAFGLGRARGVGYASCALGTASGAAFIGVAVTPWNLALTAHNGLVIAAFSLLLFYVGTLTLLMWRNGVPRARVAPNLVYLALVGAYVALVLVGPRLGTEDGHRIQVLGQKIVVYGSMLHVLLLATTTRRALAREM